MDTLKFIGREKELALLRANFEAKRFSATLLFGPRRVGKSELLRQALKGAKGRKIAFVASKTTWESNFKALVEAVKEAYHQPLAFEKLGDLLRYIGEASKKEKTIFVLDEYSFFRDENGEVDSDFQQFIDHYQHLSRLSLVLSGSIVRVMTGIIERGEPLYGRFETIIPLAPFNYKEAALFFPERTPEEKLFLYGCLGGVPHYLLMVDPDKSVEENVISLFFGLNATLKSEADSLLDDELARIENANAVLTLIGSKRLHYSDINQLFPSGSGNGASYILSKLMAVGLLKKSFVLTEKDQRNSSYEIADPFLRFYYTFYASTRSYSLLYSPEELYARFVKKPLETLFLPRIFEEVAREFLIEENRALRLNPPLLGLGAYAFDRKNEAGKWVNAEFDLVGRDEKGLTDYECKYHAAPLNEDDLEIEKASIAQSGLKFYRLGFFSRKGFAPSLLSDDNLLLYSLDDLYR